MTDHSPSSSVSKPGVQVNEPEGGAVFEPYENPAGGWGALHATAQALREQSIVLKGSMALLSMNQPDGLTVLGVRGRIRSIPVLSSSARMARRPFPSNSPNEK
jgi:hypothetical protein